MKIVISGGGGYIGTSLVTELVKLKKIKCVKVIDSFNFPWLLRNKNKIKNSNKLLLHKKDISKIKLKDLLGFSILIDFNGLSNDPVGELKKKYTYKINFKERVRVAKLAKKALIKNLIFQSTCSVYGFSKKILNENSRKKPISIYAKANLKAEKMIFKLRNNNFNVNIIRCATVYGKSQNMRLDLVINKFVYLMNKNLEISIDGNGEQMRPFISINEINKFYTKLIFKKKKSFIMNLVSFNSNILNIANKIRKILKSKSIITLSRKNIDLRNYNVISKNQNKIFKLKRSNFKQQIRELSIHLQKNKIRENKSTVRIKFYKNFFNSAQ